MNSLIKLIITEFSNSILFHHIMLLPSVNHLLAILFFPCHLHCCNVFHLVSSAGLKEPLCVYTCMCQVECVGLNGAGVDPDCPELAWRSPLPTEAENRTGAAGSLPLHSSVQGAQLWTTLDSQHNCTLYYTRCAVSTDITQLYIINIINNIYNL